VADDYAQHYLCDSRKNRIRSGRGRRYCQLTLGLVSNLLLRGLVFPVSPSAGNKSVSAIVHSSLTYYVFPLLLTGFTFEQEPGLLKLATLWEQQWPAWVMKNRSGLGLLLLVVIAGGILKLTPRDDVRLLQSVSPVMMQTADKIKKLFPSADSSFSGVGGNQQDWFQTNNGCSKLWAKAAACSEISMKAQMGRSCRQITTIIGKRLRSGSKHYNRSGFTTLNRIK
jgi:hypothetical protein